MKLYDIHFAAMASPGQVRIAAANQRAARRIAQRAIDEISRIERHYSRYRPDSIISRINAAAGGAAVRVDDETVSLLNFADALYRQSDGLFDVTSGVLRRAWNFKSPRVPGAAEIDALLPRVGWVKVDRDGREVRLLEPGMELDFGGFGKEYAVDRAAALLLDQGVAHGFIDLGGDLRVVGPQPDGEPWSIGIQHPRQANRVIAHVPLTTGALTTSGDYERFFVIDGQRYCHILDPRTGWPVTTWQSITAIAPIAIAAGACSTIAMLKQTQAIAFLKAQSVSYCLVDAQGELQMHTMETGAQ